MQRIIWTIAFLVGFGAQAQTLPDAVTGYAGYRFGMTVQQAERVAPGRKAQGACDFPGVALCIEFPEVIAGRSANVVVQFKGSPAVVTQVVVQYLNLDARPGSGACENSYRAVFASLSQRYGPPSHPERGGAVWLGRKSGAIKAAFVCFDRDRGVVTVQYHPSAAL